MLNSEHFGMNIMLLGDYQVGKSTFRTTYINKKKKRLSGTSDSFVNRSSSDAVLHKNFIKYDFYANNYYDHILTDFLTTDQRYSNSDEKLKNNNLSLISNADIYLLFVDINNEKTFTALDFWNERIKEYNPRDELIPKMVIVTKSDLPWKIEESDVYKWCLLNKASYRITSSNEYVGFDNLFEDICFRVLNSKKYMTKILNPGLYSTIPYYIQVNMTNIRSRKQEDENNIVNNVKFHNVKFKNFNSCCLII